MSTTDELKRMLDEHGVEWWDSRYGEQLVFQSEGVKWFANDGCRDGMLELSTIAITPEQAIAATLGEADEGCYLMRDGKKFPVELDCGFVGIMPIAITVAGFRYLLEVPDGE